LTAFGPAPNSRQLSDRFDDLTAPRRAAGSAPSSRLRSDGRPPYRPLAVRRAQYPSSRSRAGFNRRYVVVKRSDHRRTRASSQPSRERSAAKNCVIVGRRTHDIGELFGRHSARREQAMVHRRVSEQIVASCRGCASAPCRSSAEASGYRRARRSSGEVWGHSWSSLPLRRGDRTSSAPPELLLAERFVAA